MPREPTLLIIDGRYVYNSLLNYSMAIDFVKLRQHYEESTQLIGIQYYIGFAGRSVPGIITRLANSGYRVKYRQETTNPLDHLLTLTTDLLYLVEAMHFPVNIVIFAGYSALDVVLDRARNYANVTLVADNAITLRRHADRYISLREHLLDIGAAQAMNFTPENLAKIDWKEDSGKESMENLIVMPEDA